MLTAIDQIANRNHLQIIKAALPYLPRNEQKMISCCVKVMELKNVMRFFSRPSFQLQSCEAGGEPPHLSDLLGDIRSCCDDSDQQLLDQICNLMNTMELYAMMAQMGDFVSGAPAGEEDTCQDQDCEESHE